MFVMARALGFRARSRELFERGAYVPLATYGTRRESIFAFARALDASTPPAFAITCVPRLIGSLTPDASAPPLGRGVWDDTWVELPAAWWDPDTRAPALRDVFTDAPVQAERIGDRWTMPAATLFDRFPVSLLAPSTTCST
jgi:(1->4)-alpha-D-glucan 1-alpha-D-glucosylmutase